MGLFDFLTSGKISSLIGSYPVTMPPHPAGAARLTTRDAEENLAWFLAHRAQRSASATRLLSACDIALPAGPGDIEAFAQRLDAFFKRELVKYAGFAKVLGDHWESRQATDPDPGICFLQDLSVLLGDLVIAHSSVFRWDIDRDAWRKRAKASTVGRIVLFADGDKERSVPSEALDLARGVVEDMWEVWRMRAAPGLQRKNVFLYLIQLFEGRYDPT